MTTTIQAALAQGMRLLSEVQADQAASQDVHAEVQNPKHKIAQQPERARTARLDAQVLLAHILGVDRSALYAHPERTLSPEQEQRYRDLLARRAQGEPVAYLTGHKEFFDLDFLVDRRVLIPRPETELLVEAALSAIRARLDGDGRHVPIVADIGTGSGAIPIALAVNEPRLPYLYASDISEDALAVAALNSQRHNVEKRVRLLRGDLTAPLPEPVDILTANLPYIGTQEEALMDDEVLNYEPRLALFSEQHGLAHTQRLFTNLVSSSTLLPGATLVLEIGYTQREALARLLATLLPLAHVTFLQDYAGWDRVVQVVI